MNIEIQISLGLRKEAGKFVPKEEIRHEIEEWYSNNLPEELLIDDSVYVINDLLVTVS